MELQKLHYFRFQVWPYRSWGYIALIIDCVLHYSFFWSLSAFFVLLGLVNACILFIFLHKWGKDRDRIDAVKASFATGHKTINKENKNARKKFNIYLIYYVKIQNIQTTTKKPQKNK